MALKFIVLGFLFVSFSGLSRQNIEKFSPLDLEKKAEGEGFGYKAANLFLLKSLLEDRTLSQLIKPFKAEVPNFVGITSQEVKDLLELRKLHLDSEWLKILEKHAKDLDIEQVLKEKALPITFINACEILSQDIEAAFNFLADHTDLVSIVKLRQFLAHATAHEFLTCWHAILRDSEIG